MFEKIEIEKAENGYILYVDRGLRPHGLPTSPKVFSSERALLKELRILLKENGTGSGVFLDIGDFKGESAK